MDTQVRRIEMDATDDLARAIEATSNNMLAGDYRVASTFVVGSSLIIVYQKLG